MYKEPENYTYGGAEVSDLDPSFSNRQEVAMLKQASLEFIDEEDKQQYGNGICKL